jgi:hypothetical protein
MILKLNSYTRYEYDEIEATSQTNNVMNLVVAFQMLGFLAHSATQLDGQPSTYP